LHRFRTGGSSSYRRTARASWGRHPLVPEVGCIFRPRMSVRTTWSAHFAVAAVLGRARPPSASPDSTSCAVPRPGERSPTRPGRVRPTPPAPPRSTTAAVVEPRSFDLLALAIQIDGSRGTTLGGASAGTRRFRPHRRDRSSSWSTASWSRRSTPTCSRPPMRGCFEPLGRSQNPTEKRKHPGSCYLPGVLLSP
jgi:hypothetical protein